MNLLQKMLNGLEKGQNVWEEQGTTIYTPIQEFNKKSKYTYLGSVVDNDLGADAIYCPLYSRVDHSRIANISVYADLAIAEFLEVLEESARTLETAKKENKLSPKELVLLEFDLKEGLERLYKSLDAETMKTVYASIEYAAFNNLSSRHDDVIYLFFKENATNWLNEKVANAGV